MLGPKGRDAAGLTLAVSGKPGCRGRIRTVTCLGTVDSQEAPFMWYIALRDGATEWEVRPRVS